jgi:hypothetical protein
MAHLTGLRHNATVTALLMHQAQRCCQVSEVLAEPPERAAACVDSRGCRVQHLQQLEESMAVAEAHAPAVTENGSKADTSDAEQFQMQVGACTRVSKRGPSSIAMHDHESCCLFRAHEHVSLPIHRCLAI